MIKLFFDTETTGMVEWSRKSSDPSQPDLIQLAAILKDGKRELASLNVIVQATKPSHLKAIEAHGITDEMNQQYGIGLDAAISPFMDMLDIADEVICHNTKFDTKIMKRAHFIVTGKDKDIFEDKKVTCTMITATTILRLKQKGGRGLKWPTLEECSQYFFNEGIDGAHDALVDTRTCIKVYDQLLLIGAFKNGK